MRFMVSILAGSACLSIVLVSSGSASPLKSGSLRPGVGAERIRLGMTLAQVRRVLGTPSRISRHRRYGFSEYVQYVWGAQSTWQIGVSGLSGRPPRVVYIATARPVRTPNGAGVGSTYKSLQRKLGARCYRRLVSATLPGAATEYRDLVLCYVGRPRAPVTVFPLTMQCAITKAHYSGTCPNDKRRYRALEVWIVSRLGQEILGIDEAKSKAR
jgi:hypothetical protein